MKTKTVLLWCLLGALIVTYLIVKFLVKDYNIAQIKTVDEMSEVQSAIVKGYDVVKDYDSLRTGIRDKKVDFSIVSKNNSLIGFTNHDELQAVIYNLTDYYKVWYTYEGIDYYIYSINDYDELERNVTSKKTYNKELLASYLGVDPSTLKSNVEKVRDLLEGEAYGKSVISTFKDKQEVIENGSIYFILDDENMFKLEDVESKVADNDIFKKEYEINGEGKLVGYTFTKVLE